MTRYNGSNGQPPEWPAPPRDQPQQPRAHQPQQPRAQRTPYDGEYHDPQQEHPNGYAPEPAWPQAHQFEAGQADPMRSEPWHEPSRMTPPPYPAASAPPTSPAVPNEPRPADYDPWQALAPTNPSRHQAPAPQPPTPHDDTYHYPRSRQDAPQPYTEPPAFAPGWPGRGAQHSPGAEHLPAEGYNDVVPPPFQAVPAQPEPGYAPEFAPYQINPAYAPPQQQAPQVSTDLGKPPPPAYDAPPVQPAADAADYFGGNAEPALENQPTQAPGMIPGSAPQGAWDLRGPTYDDQPAAYYAPQHRAEDTAPPLDLGMRDAARHDHLSHAEPPPGFALPPQHQHTDIAPQEHGYEEDYEDEEPGQRGGLGRSVVIAAALAGSIVIGGGIAYGYNAMFAATGDRNGAPPVIKADGGPARVPPGDPGGKRFPHTDSRVLEKMGQRLPPSTERRNAGAEAKPEGGTDSSRVKVVTTMTFDRNGRMVVSETPQPAPSAGATPQPSVPPSQQPPPVTATQPLPGMTIMNGNGFGPTTTAASEPRAEPPAPQPRVEAPPPQPKVVAVTRAAPRQTANAPPLPTRSTVERGAAAPPRQPERTRVAAVTPRQPAPAPRAGGGAANGYVAVLATKSSRMEALKTFVDLQTRYADVLGSTIPAVQKADLSARNLGIQYRAVVGPPGSRKAASQVCTRLRTAGYQGCWVKAY